MRWGGSDEPLACYQLRGGMYRSDAWAHSPAQPAIIASTVDQLGSRLLFRAYGRSPKAWPIQAGLAGNDALILLDEAHCARPFLQTLQAVQRYRTWAEAPLSAPFRAVVMSATPPELEDVFRDESEERRTPEHPLGDRQLAAKPAKLELVAKAKGGKALDELAAALAKQAEALVDRRPLACVVFVNRVATARAVHDLLSRRFPESTVLLTGRMRPFDKDDTVVRRLKPLSSDLAHGRELDGPQFVVATQTLEVGADLDFDLLVTECASLDALRQRFGRLNRMGRVIESRDAEGRPTGARAAILVRVDQSEKSDDDPVYGAALANTWRWLLEQAGDAGEVDFGITALEPRLPEPEKLAELIPPAKAAPVMLPAHVDCWAQTALEPMPTPEPALFLHGPGTGSTDVQVCWRADLLAAKGESTEASLTGQALEVLSLCPPATAECVAVPIGRLLRWLSGETAADDSPDVEGVDVAAGDGRLLVEPRRVVRWRGRDDAKVLERHIVHGQPEWREITEAGPKPVADREALRPGDVIVIPAQTGGWKGLGDLARGEDGSPILDFGDRAHLAIRAKALLRLHPEVLADWPETPATARMKALAKAAAALFEEDFEGLVAELRSALADLAEDRELPANWRWLRQTTQGLLLEKPFGRSVQLHPVGGLILRGLQFLPPEPPYEEDEAGSEADRFSDEDDASSSSGAKAIPLPEHLQGVAGYARRFAEACRLPPPLAAAVERAGLLHDLGKADPRFQALLRGGRPAPREELLAKSGEMPQGRAAHERARKAAGYPAGGRHELLSIRLAESAPNLLPEDSDFRVLVLHLVASHHGHCRPFAPVVFDEKPVAVTWTFEDQVLTAGSDHGLERLDSGVADRYWRLTRRYGWWGLAWLESILRLADHRRSEAEQNEGKKHGQR